MSNETPTPKQTFSADWLLRGSLTKIGDTLDRFLGRKWTPSSTLATSELIERIKKLLDSEARDVPGKGLVVPHDIRLKVEWNKFSTDDETIAEQLERELLTATIDHINDSLYYTFAPVSITVEPDYFIEGVQLAASFGDHSSEESVPDLNVTIAGIDLGQLTGQAQAAPGEERTTRIIVRLDPGGTPKETSLNIKTGRSISVGRAASNGLVIDDKSVSKIHASLSINESGELLLADTGSTNGTFLNGERIAYGKAIKITADDKIAFGDVNVSFEPIVEEPYEDQSVSDQAKTVEIGGFEFTSRSEEDDKGEEAEVAGDEPK